MLIHSQFLIYVTPSFTREKHCENLCTVQLGVAVQYWTVAAQHRYQSTVGWFGTMLCMDAMVRW